MKRLRVPGWCLALAMVFVLGIGGAVSNVSAAYVPMGPVQFVLVGDTVAFTQDSFLVRNNNGTLTDADSPAWWYKVGNDVWTQTNDITTPVVISGQNGSIIQFGIYPALAQSSATEGAWITTAGTGNALFTGNGNEITTLPNGLGVDMSGNPILIDWDQITWLQGTATWNIQDATTAITLTQGSMSPVPIPAAAWLLGSGLIGMLGLRRKLNT